MRILLIKMSSMGDLIHTLPALSDAAKVFPDFKVDWVVEDTFAEIPRWHKHVDKVIIIALRRWRKNLWQAIKSGEIKEFFQQLRAQRYDVVIDAQALIKSSVISSLTLGKVYGYDAQSVRSKFANLAYNKTFTVDQQLHAIKRIRILFSKVLGYPYIDNLPDYGLDTTRFLPVSVTLPKEYVIFIHNASWTSKLWPEDYWAALVKKATAAGLKIILPWGNLVEQQRANRLAAVAENKHAIVLPTRLKLSELATIIKNAKAAVLGDTGLGHLTAALNVPAVSLYGATDPALIGTMGPEQVHIAADFPCAPCKLRECNYKKSSVQKPACYTTIPPEKVWNALEKICANAQ